MLLRVGWQSFQNFDIISIVVIFAVPVVVESSAPSRVRFLWWLSLGLVTEP